MSGVGSKNMKEKTMNELDMEILANRVEQLEDDIRLLELENNLLVIKNLNLQNQLDNAMAKLAEPRGN